MPDFLKETESAISVGEPSLLKLLHLPYPSATHNFLRATLDIKDTVVRETWVRSGRRVSNPTLYTGALGMALMFKSYQATGDPRDLNLCSEIVTACDSSSQGLPYITFICGRAGICALGAAVAKVACLLRVITESSCAENRENAVVVLFSVCMNDRTKLQELREEEGANKTISVLAQNGAREHDVK